MVSFEDNGDGLSEEIGGEAEDVEGRFVGEEVEEVGLEVGLGDGLKVGPEVGGVEEVQGACGVGASFGERSGTEEEEEFDEEKIGVVVFAALKEFECLGSELFGMRRVEEVEEEGFHCGVVV